MSIYASCKQDQPAKDCQGGLLLKCIYGSDENFDQSCTLLYQKQTPMFLKDGGLRVAKLEKQEIRLIRKDMNNAYPLQKA